MAVSNNLFAQNDFITLDKQTYDYYLKGDYKNLKKTGDKMLLQGIDYYYLRIRLGMLGFSNQRYSSAIKHFKKAIQFNSWDTISNEFIYYSYLYLGRRNDANLYLESIPWEKRNNTLKSINNHKLQELYLSSSASGYDVTLYDTRSDYYEAVKSSLSINTGFEYYFSPYFKGNFAYSNFRKSGTVYSSTLTTGGNLDYTQNQLYIKLTGYILPGWEFSGFGHLAFYTDGSSQQGNGRSRMKIKTEYLGGAGLSRNGGKIRTGINASFSNFASSSQIRGEGYLTYLPFGNLNLYFTTGGMYQTDKHWGETYQANQEVGVKVLKFLWLESGIAIGNSFLYARNQGLSMNNSYQIPATTAYGNLIFLLGRKFGITLSPYYSLNHFYSWDLNAYSRYDKLSLNSYGCSIKLTFKN